MKKVNRLKKLVLESLMDDDERFEAIYYYVNDRIYQNMHIDVSPLYKNLEEMYCKKDVYTPIEVYNCIKGLVNDGYIECIQIFKSNSFSKITKIFRPNFDNYAQLCWYWFRISDRGLSLIK